MLRALEHQDVKAKPLVAGFEVRTSTPEWFGDFIKSEAVKWAKVINEAGIKAE